MGRALFCLQQEEVFVARPKVHHPLYQRPISPVVLADVQGGDVPRTSTGSEFDRVLGGGLVPGALILVGGDPVLANRRFCYRSASFGSR